ncbi:hypothetical protein RAS1_18310 [Phycisphaerae bacterium RAS1]|nr:hypothetical protein RAS1_18310 [Phycisphaerae bacterium RAS1]
MKKQALWLVVILLAVGGAYFAWSYLATDASEFSQSSACAYHEECGWTGSLTFGLGDPSVQKCPKCGRESVVPLAKCRKCGNRQILNDHLRSLFPDRKDIPEATRCKKCDGPIVHGD